MSDGIQIQKASLHDLTDTWKLVEQYFASVADFAGEMELPSKPAFMAYWAETATRHVFVARTSTEAVGFCLLQEIDGAPYDMTCCLELGAIFVRETWRRRGISKALWREAAQIADSLAIPITSEVSVDNKLSLEIIRNLLADCPDDELAERLRPKSEEPQRMQVVLWKP